MRTDETPGPTPPAPETITLGKYQLLKRLAAGGMAEIFVAKVSGIPGFAKIVCIKRILPQLATSREFVQMFLDEARIAATLHHPNIVQTYDVDSADGMYFIAMEYLHGEDVRTIMKALRQLREPLPLEYSLAIIIGLACGLHYAHDQVGLDGTPLGIVHRDVTPQNLFVTYDGNVKIVDFGVAKATNRFNKETRFGILKGKIPYMSPEQCRAEPLDRRSDLYAIGIMLYELTTGSRLYKGASEFEILKKIVEQPVVPPSAKHPAYPPALEAIVMKALAKRRTERYQTARDLATDLEDFAREHRLNVSSLALSGFMHRIFGNKVEAWREAQAAGELPAHVAKLPGPDDRSAISIDPSDLEEEVEDDADTRQTPSGSGQVGSPTTVARPRKRRFVWPAAAAAVCVAAAAYLLWRGAKETPAPVDTPVAAAAPPDAAPALAVVEPPDAAAAEVQVAIVDAAPAAGAIRVTTKPPGARVELDGTPLEGRSPVTLSGLAPGEHAVKVELKGYHATTTKVIVVGGEEAPLAVELKPREETEVATAPEVPDAKDHGDDGKGDGDGKVETAPAGPGELRVASTPSCIVLVDGKKLGNTPMSGISLSAGTHKVTLINEKFSINRTFTVEITAGGVTKKRWDFDVPPEP